MDYTNLPAIKIHIAGSGAIGFAYSNRYWNATDPFSHAKFGGYLVTRLDGYSEADAKALTARSLMADRNLSHYLREGKVLLDVEPVFGLGRQGDAARSDYHDEHSWRSRLGVIIQRRDMRACRHVLTTHHVPVESDLTPASLLMTSICSVIFPGANATWNMPAGYLSLFFAPGAVCDTAVSTSARTFLPTHGGQSLLVDLIAHGLTGGKGYTDEPLLQAIALPTIVLDRRRATRWRKVSTPPPILCAGRTWWLATRCVAPI